MKSAAFVLVALSTALSPSACLAQSSSPQTAPASRASSVVSVQELTLSRKASRAFQKGSDLLLKGDPRSSLSYFQAVIAQAPSFFGSYHNLGLALYRLGQIDAAAENFQKAIDLTDGDFAPSLFGLSMIFYRHGELAEAESLIRRGLFVQPKSGVGRYCLGLVQYSLGRTEDAQKSALEALSLDPAETDAYLLLARTHERQHNPPAVIADIQSYLKLSPNGALQPDALDLLHRAQQSLSPQSVSPR